ncbi:DUF4159 domain-containing protein [Cerasicoccus maritimus]|uniref:DUF4159 domain-containing protein n=1 Tax=Cerasicoccus maritimus TaxID=490089 RepID=UPI002852B2E9|nr:DUF4159 domain-containing protein [Cerasicoccus maritimus]
MRISGFILVVLGLTFPALLSATVTGPNLSTFSVTQLVQGRLLQRNYPDALPTLIETLNDTTTFDIELDPVFIESFADPKLLQHPVCYVNFGDRPDWELTDEEKANLKGFLDRGGFLYIDAGINADFLRKSNPAYSQSHSFAEWRVSPEIETVFQDIYSGERFRALPRDHALFRAYHAGLPDASVLPETVRDFVVNEKWPQGTYSAMGLEVNGRLAVLCMPILAMGWGQNEMEQWSTFIGFRIREGAEGLSERLSEAAYSGTRFEAVREDGRQDIIYTQQEAMPAWVQEPSGDWRVFRYYYTPEISDYAHRFYTQLGVNIFVYAFTR